MISTSVSFETSDEALQKIYNRAEEIERGNIALMDGRRVLIEGSIYRNIWIETQPMGGEMYAKRDMDVAYNNQILFLNYQRKDGRLPRCPAAAAGWYGGGFLALAGAFLPLSRIECLLLDA